MQQLGEEMPRLLRTRHVARLVFHPHAARRGEAERVAQRVGARERSEDEAGAGDTRDFRVEFFDERVAVGFVHAVRRGEGVPCEISPERDERVGVLGASQWRDVALDEEHVVAVVVGGVRTAP